ncbi:Crp/Fnr family transcriptional regulator [Limnohabitans sp. Rim8]|uniref:Crp/Fnr family transcriptional regulator n=1 Tax=Limnohabitans sp. Rim8 TaxID=1100718 RepID=UPI002639DD56|nr:Crp/Fnr family transcriptional regulator [Limnohabitans sp. Rim8]
MSAQFTEGQTAVGVFTLRKGMVKLLRATADGRERIVRVMRPGDVIGLEALATARYDSEAIALVEAQVCRIPLSVLHHLSAKSPRLHKRLMQKCQQALKDAEDWLADLNFGSARQRVAALALKMRDPDQPGITTFFARGRAGPRLLVELTKAVICLSRLITKSFLVIPSSQKGNH